VNIRPLAEGDLAAASALDRASFSLPWPESAFRFEFYENPLSRLWVAETESGQIVGLMVVWLIVDEAHIANLAVAPEFRQQGIGARLLTVGLIDAQARGMLTATLEVRVGNVAAQALYRRFGFAPVGRRARYYQDNGEDALILTCPDLGALATKLAAVPLDSELP
jgi:ribosomal-protein-alanine N-acetyltransferase